jgi:enoyl-CoA hydratase/carnithine racemase
MDPVPAGPPLLIDETELVSMLGGGLSGDEVGPAWDRPLVAVALTDSAAATRLRPLVAGLPCVTVGATDVPFPDPVGFDVFLCAERRPPAPWVGCPDGLAHAVERLAGQVSAHPVAALVLVQLLRMGPGLGVGDALAAESLAYSALQSGVDHRSWLAGRDHRGERVRRPSADGWPAVLVEREGGTLWVTLHRPEVRNAVDASLRDGLIDGLRVAFADPSVTEVVLAGAGPDFCSGGDLDEFGTATDAAVAHAIRTTRRAGWWIHAGAARCTARVHGACVGAGLELAAFAGRVVADPASRFVLPELSMGLVPGAGGTVSLPRRIGPARTAWMALTGSVVGADTAQAWGLVDEIGEVIGAAGPPPPGGHDGSAAAVTTSGGSSARRVSSTAAATSTDVWYP